MGLLQSADRTAKAFRDGTHRSRAPSETIARLQPLLAAAGITRVANLTGLDRVGVPVVMVCRPNARSSAVFHGKGLTLAAAKASGLMEAVETWHAEQMQVPLRFGSPASLRETVPVANIEGLPMRAGARLDPQRPLFWMQGENLADGAPLWLPAEIVHMNATLDAPPSSGCFSASTNGLASGNHVLEAIVHALCEVIERDATSLWSHRAAALQDSTRIDAATVDDPNCRSVMDLLAAADLDVAIWEVTTDVGVPAFLCQATDRLTAYGHVGIGAGCHALPEIALSRALTEAAQVRTTYIVGSREDIVAGDYASTALASRSAQALARARPVAKPRRFDAATRYEFDTFHAEVSWILERLRLIGCAQAIVVDMTHPEFGIAVVRVVVPGLEGSDHLADYVPGPRAQAVLEGRL